jgi:hypothetical protein
MPLQQWIALYGVRQANRLDDLAHQVGIIHASNPKRTREQLLRAAARLRMPSRTSELFRDTERLRAFMERRGVKVQTAESTKPE